MAWKPIILCVISVLTCASVWIATSDVTDSDEELVDSSHVEKKEIPPPVKVTMYMESLCPDCIRAMTKKVYPAYLKLANTGILDLELVPFGKAQVAVDGFGGTHFVCQHGAEECLGNMILACGIKYAANDSKAKEFVECTEYYGPHQAEWCATASGHGHEKQFWPNVDRCRQGREGVQLMHKMADLTEALNPPLKSVPWYTIDGVHSKAVQEGLSGNFLAYVCLVYTGPKPNVCRDLLNGNVNDL